jgi:mRNA interferase RelE/StbE
MAAYRPDIPRHVAEVIRRLPQDIKRSVKQALRSLSADPLPGPRLMRERSGLRKFKVRRFRIVYQINRKARLIRIFAVGHRPEVYEELAHQLHEAARPVIKRTRRQRRSSQT